MSEIAPYGREAPPPPEIKKGQLVEITEITMEEVTGKYGPQYQIDGVLAGGFKARAWVKKYDDPTVKTKIYKLCVLIDAIHGKYSKDVDDALKRLLEYGRVYFICTGHREYEEKTYPKFSVYDLELPGKPKTQVPIENPASKADAIIAEILIQKPDMDPSKLSQLIEDELTNSGDMFGEDTAAVLVARTLGVKLEATGERIA